MHRSKTVLNLPFNDPAWAIVVMADKFVGDEERVRPGRAFVLTLLTHLRCAWIPLRRGAEHDRANFAIKGVNAVFSDSEIALCLTIDRRVCQAKFIIDLYDDRFRACQKAARYLGFSFSLVFNGQRFALRADGSWFPTIS